MSLALLNYRLSCVARFDFIVFAYFDIKLECSLNEINYVLQFIVYIKRVNITVAKQKITENFYTLI